MSCPPARGARSGARCVAAAGVWWTGLLLAVCGGPQRSGPDELVVLIEATVENLDPRFAASGYGIKVSRLVVAPLVSLDTEDSRPRMELAETVAQPEPQTYVVTLRAGARFSDGSPVTAQDVVATMEDIKSDRSLSPYRAAFGRVDSVEVIDAQRVRFRLSEPHAPFVSDLDMGILPAALLRRHRPRPGLPIADGDLVGAGPLRIHKRTPTRIELVPNPYFHGTRPALGRYVIKTVEDDNSRLLSLVSGGGDLTQNTVAPLLLPALRRSSRLVVVSGPGLMTSYLGLNTADPKLRDPRVRRAIGMAIDRRRIISAKLRGKAELATSILPSHHWAHNPALRPLPYDPAAARRLLAEAGLRAPAGGGPVLSLTYKTSTNRFRVAIARVIARQLGEVGIRVTVRPYEWGVFFSDLKRGNFQLATLQMTELAEPDYHYYFFHSSMAADAHRPEGGGNRWGYRDPEVDRWLEQGRGAQDRANRRGFYLKVQARLARDLPIVPLWHEENLAVMRRGLGGFRMLPNARFAPLLRVTKGLGPGRAQTGMIVPQKRRTSPVPVSSGASQRNREARSRPSAE